LTERERRRVRRWAGGICWGVNAFDAKSFASFGPDAVVYVAAHLLNHALGLRSKVERRRVHARTVDVRSCAATRFDDSPLRV
jgi:hypothetical protein